MTSLPGPSASTAAAGWAPASRTRSSSPAPTVTVVENDDAAADAARDRVTASLQRAEERGKLGGPPADAPRAALRDHRRPSTLAGAGLVVEAVPEDPALKARVLAAVEAGRPGRACWPPTPARCRSTASPPAWPRPSAFVGLHFFNPVPASDLVEIVVGADDRRRTCVDRAPRAGSRRWARPRSR